MLASLMVTSVVTIALVLRSERKILWEDLNHNGETLSQTWSFNFRGHVV